MLSPPRSRSLYCRFPRGYLHLTNLCWSLCTDVGCCSHRRCGVPEMYLVVDGFLVKLHWRPLGYCDSSLMCCCWKNLHHWKRLKQDFILMNSRCSFFKKKSPVVFLKLYGVLCFFVVFFFFKCSQSFFLFSFPPQ